MSPEEAASLESTFDTLDLLEALFPLPGELSIPDEVSSLREKVRAGSSSPSSFSKDYKPPSELACTLSVTLEQDLEDEERSIDEKRSIPINIRLSVAENAKVKIYPSQPDWLPRKPFESLSDALSKHIQENESEEDATASVLNAVEWIRENASEYTTTTDALSTDSTTELEEDETNDPNTFVRIWMLLPSLSTRSKRDDLVNYAPSYSITGIVLAGKPGLLILEAPSTLVVYSYLSFIKTHSWSDIPSGHKKISERLREENLPMSERKFQDMQEITELVVKGDKGHRGNRGDMAVLKSWLDERSLGDRLGKVLGANI